MPKGVVLSPKQFIINSVKYLRRKSADAQEIILSNIEEELSRAAKEDKQPAAEGTEPVAGDAGDVPVPKAKKKKKSKKRKPAADEGEASDATEGGE